MGILERKYGICCYFKTQWWIRCGRGFWSWWGQFSNRKGRRGWKRKEEEKEEEEIHRWRCWGKNEFEFNYNPLLTGRYLITRAMQRHDLRGPLCFPNLYKLHLSSQRLYSITGSIWLLGENSETWYYLTAVGSIYTLSGGSIWKVRGLIFQFNFWFRNKLSGRYSKFKYISQFRRILRLVVGDPVGYWYIYSSDR